MTRLKQAEAALLDADRRKDEFLALLSHELRNPLAPILTAAQLIRLRSDKPPSHELEVILRNASISRGSWTTCSTSPACRVARSVSTGGPSSFRAPCPRPSRRQDRCFEERGHRLDLSVSPEGLCVEADEVRLTQIINNLLSNAARYTPPGGTVTITGAREDEAVVLRVRDTGTGIESALLPAVFEMFVQGAQRSE